MVTKKQLENLSRGRATRRTNLRARQLPRRRRFVKVPRNRPIINPDFLPVESDVGINEKISAEENLFANLNDVVPRQLQARRRK